MGKSESDLITEMSKQLQLLIMEFGSEMTKKDLEIKELKEKLKVFEDRIVLLETKSSLNKSEDDKKEIGISLDESSAKEIATEKWAPGEEVVNLTGKSWTSVVYNLNKIERKYQMQGNTFVSDGLFFTKVNIGMREVIQSSDFWRMKEHIMIKHKEGKAIFFNTLNWYFEVTLIGKDEKNPITVSMGVSNKVITSTSHIGWEEGCIGMHSDDGRIFYMNGSGNKLTTPFTDGDTMGCGFTYKTQKIFFTRNGKFLGLMNFVSGLVLPAVCVEYAESVKINTGKEPFLFDVGSIE
ncbi:hypothetical protein EIN_403510 [Entamoeba invadens IP1]|uniref:B30.2/SPRY domain-containing protein n=1 Tax=Entamoeba invadens IP1 TaxID=370355 RepID=A0A0A1U6J5_ENTIV|nr:hypothetical protein EIN_403510 [Entamoeba invadens IP1]ELP90017.1 hypothetical protein EIN_403510 [Entamoeba invadens IP1]|eukprot:XP_004256788.1 hypothetical protein EIN_403510 [Entamoeba invadens IP1]